MKVFLETVRKTNPPFELVEIDLSLGDEFSHPHIILGEEYLAEFNSHVPNYFVFGKFHKYEEGKLYFGWYYYANANTKGAAGRNYVSPKSPKSCWVKLWKVIK